MSVSSVVVSQLNLMHGSMKPHGTLKKIKQLFAAAMPPGG